MCATLRAVANKLMNTRVLIGFCKRHENMKSKGKENINVQRTSDYTVYYIRLLVCVAGAT